MGQLNDDIQSQAPVFEYRTNWYRYVAQLFKNAPNREIILAIRENGFPCLSEEEECTASAERAKTALNGSIEKVELAVATDYAAVFLGITQHKNKFASPYESVYMSNSRLVMQDARDQVLACYREQGLASKESLHEPEDHIYLELQFVGELSERTVGKIREGNVPGVIELASYQSKFIEDHLLNWIPDFVQNIEKYAKSAFYPAVGTCMLTSIQADRHYLDELCDAAGIHVEKVTSGAVG